MTPPNSPQSLEAESEIPALIATLQETERRLEELTGGEIDTVSTGSGQPFLLRRAQNEMRDHEAAKQTAILNALPANIALLDGWGCIVSVNEPWRRFAGANLFQDPAMGVGLNYVELCEKIEGPDAEYAHQVAAGIRAVLAGTKTFTLEYPCHSPNEQRWFQMTVTPLAENRARGVIVMHAEITERRRAEAALEELAQKTARRERMLTKTLSSLHDFAYIYDRAGRFLFANQPLLNLWGLKLEEAVGKDFFALGYPDALARRLQREVQEVFEQGKSLTGEMPYTSPGGAKVIYEYIFSPAFGADGAVEFVVGSTRDITQRKEAEAILRENEERFRLLTALADAMRPLANAEEIAAVTVRILGDLLGVSRCAYADVDKDRQWYTILQVYPGVGPSLAGKRSLSPLGAEALAILRRGETLIVRNAAAEHFPGDGVEGFGAGRMQASIICPLLKDGELCALLAVQQSMPRDWLPGEIPIVQEFAVRCWATVERRRAEGNLRKSEALLRIAGRTARLGGWSVELPEFRATWSDEVCAIHEVPPGTVPTVEQAVGFYAPESRELIKRAVAACAREGKPYDLEMDIITAKGKRVGVRSIGEAERNSAGVITRLQGAFQDITERKRIAEKLRASEKQFKALFDQAGVGVAQADALTGRYLQVNRRYFEITGRSEEELAELTATAITHPENVARDRELVRQVITGALREFTVEKRYLRKDGSEVWVQVTVSAMWAPGDPPDNFMAVAQDITERKKLQEQFQQAQKMDAIGTLAGGIAHDFNNILAAITGYSELARMVLPDGTEAGEHLGAVLQASARATDLVRQILTFSRQERPERRLIELRPIVEESVKLLRATIPSTIEFEIALAANAPTVLADPTQVHQILMNLGTNAWHAMKDRSGRMQIKLEPVVVDSVQVAAQPLVKAGLYARISVSDTGSGMDAATLRRVFEPFFTTKRVGEGTGLGLSVVHGIMDSHDGAVTVFSRPGAGTVFHLYFPAQAGDPTLPAPKDGPIPRGRGERILVVDDEELLAKLCQKALTALGYEVEYSLQPDAALELVRASPERFALVLTDQTMPGMTGAVLAHQLRQIRPALPIILMTGYGLSLTPERLEAAGVTQLLLKPATLFSLGSSVHSALHRQLPPAPWPEFS
jgi:PAS domain S-box-containing protein